MLLNLLIYNDYLAINLKNIEQEILNAQKSIYTAAKKCHIDKVNKYQNSCLVNCKYYLVSITKIISSIRNDIYLSYSYINKLLITSFFLVRKKDIVKYQVFKLIKAKIFEELTFLLLEPEWEARYENILSIERNKKYMKSMSKSISRLLQKSSIKICFHGYSLRTAVSSKKMNHQKLMYKLDNSKQFSEKLNIWLYEKNYVKSEEYINSKFLNKYICTSDKLCGLLNRILYLGLEWYLYVNLRLNFIYSKIYLTHRNNILFLSDSLIAYWIRIYLAKFLVAINSDTKFLLCILYNSLDKIINIGDINIQIQKCKLPIIQPNKSAISNLMRKIRNFLYHKNRHGFWRANTYIKKYYALVYIKKLLFRWYLHYSYILTQTNISIINSMTDTVLYIWQTKK